MGATPGDDRPPADASAPPPARLPFDAMLFLLAVVLSVVAAAVAPEFDCDEGRAPSTTTFEIVRAAALAGFFAAAALALLLRRRVVAKLACAAVYAAGGLIALGALALTANPC